MPCKGAGPTPEEDRGEREQKRACTLIYNGGAGSDREDCSAPPAVLFDERVVLAKWTQKCFPPMLVGMICSSERKMMTGRPPAERRPSPSALRAPASSSSVAVSPLGCLHEQHRRRGWRRTSLEAGGGGGYVEERDAGCGPPTKRRVAAEARRARATTRNLRRHCQLDCREKRLRFQYSKPDVFSANC